MKIVTVEFCVPQLWFMPVQWWWQHSGKPIMWISTNSRLSGMETQHWWWWNGVLQWQWTSTWLTAMKC